MFGGQLRFCKSLPEVAFLLQCLSCERQDDVNGKGKAKEAAVEKVERPPFPLFPEPPAALILYNVVDLLPPSVLPLLKRKGIAN